jgi:hypothetical protein
MVTPQVAATNAKFKLSPHRMPSRFSLATLSVFTRGTRRCAGMGILTRRSFAMVTALRGMRHLVVPQLRGVW